MNVIRKNESEKRDEEGEKEKYVLLSSSLRE